MCSTLCFLNFLDLWFGFCHYFWGILDHHLFKHFFHFTLSPKILITCSLGHVILSHSFWMLSLFLCSFLLILHVFHPFHL